jgi:hypothetical protein
MMSQDCVFGVALPAAFSPQSPQGMQGEINCFFTPQK